MVFSSLAFIFIYLPVFLAVYFFANKRHRVYWLFLGSLAFYAYGTLSQPAALMLILFTLVINYLAALGIEHFGRRKKLIFILALIYNVGCLFMFKYLGFLTESVSALVAAISGRAGPISVVELILPIGISFYTFQIISYLTDVYWGDIPAERSLARLGAYLLMFPKLISGPITPYGAVSGRLEEPEVSLSQLNAGLMDFTAGLGLKVLLANQLGRLWMDIGTIGYESISTPLAWLGIIGYSLQIYFDFWGYSLMAVGLGTMLGFDLPRNFNQPYGALTMTAFWRRWHMTLGAWFRRYVYIPLGGNRQGKGRMLLSMLVVWLLTGLWHGAGWNFVLWGILTYILISVEKLAIGSALNRWPVLGHCYMALAIPLLWTVFAITDMPSLATYFGRLFPFFGDGVNVYALDYIKCVKKFGVFILVGLFFCTEWPARWYEKYKGSLICSIFLVLVFWASVFFISKGLNDPFLYFKF